MLAVVFALLAALGNATGSVMQRLGARAVPPQSGLRLALIGLLMRRRVWLCGVLVLVCAGMLQALALYRGGLALVQPIAVAELPLALMISGRIFHSSLGARAWWGILAMSVGLTLFLFALAPANSDRQGGIGIWVSTLMTGAVAAGLLVSFASRARGNLRSGLLASAAGLGFGYTAALMKASAQAVADGGVAGLFTTWHFYAMVAAGCGAFFLYQHAVHAGPLVASQPPVTLVDPIASVVLGVVVFGESTRAGGWLGLAGAGALLMLAGAITLSRSPLWGAEIARDAH